MATVLQTFKDKFCTVDSEIFTRILFSQIALRHISDVKNL